MLNTTSWAARVSSDRVDWQIKQGCGGLCQYKQWRNSNIALVRDSLHSIWPISHRKYSVEIIPLQMVEKANTTIDDLPSWPLSNAKLPFVRHFVQNKSLQYLNRDMWLGKGTCGARDIHSVMVANYLWRNCHPVLVSHVYQLANPISPRKNFKQWKVSVYWDVDIWVPEGESKSSKVKFDDAILNGRKMKPLVMHIYEKLSHVI